MRTDFAPKKLPKQTRSRLTFDAIVDACAQLLCERGYGALTTNHIAERAGVSIGSLYEYFSDKDAIVYEVVRRTSHGFSEDAAQPLAGFHNVPLREALRAWLGALAAAMRSRQELLKAIAEEVPFAIREPHRREAWARHLALAHTAYRMAGPRVRQDRVDEVAFLIVTLVDAALNRLFLESPEGVSADDVLDELTQRLSEWVAPRSRAN
jgi:AcrR family transcriptional regulator